ncbi:MAG TPA: 1-deoxy-D-xylulose-5-phosphate reductoisomerase [Chitinophagales bacterium]|nr:1-deoxy-D-xylulose-5-phosphate reductoisomerase [Chitinophagales bacterium]
MNQPEQKRRIAILGSTGSIGTQALEVIAQQPDFFEVEMLAAGSNAALLIQQAKTFKPNSVVICDESKYDLVRNALVDEPVKVYAGHDALKQEVQNEHIHVVLTAMMGYVGLEPTIKAVQAGKTIALANKETLVVAGHLITTLAQKNGVNIYPVDSEHSAIFQCLAGEFHNPIEKLIVTASGGPFRGMSREQLEHVTKAQALKHPNWSMGRKITIDSATLMNKGLELIEARWLFNTKADQLEVLVHPQSVIHSMVQFADGSIKAQLGYPDMKLPIQFALGYPRRLKNNFERFDFARYPTLTFEKPDMETFRCLQLAVDAMAKEGNAPCALNAANEIAVEKFLQDEIRFLDIADVIEHVLNKFDFSTNPSLDTLRETDRQARRLASENRTKPLFSA